MTAPFLRRRSDLASLASVFPPNPADRRRGRLHSLPVRGSLSKGAGEGDTVSQRRRGEMVRCRSSAVSELGRVGRGDRIGRIRMTSPPARASSTSSAWFPSLPCAFERVGSAEPTAPLVTVIRGISPLGEIEALLRFINLLHPFDLITSSLRILQVPMSLFGEKARGWGCERKEIVDAEAGPTRPSPSVPAELLHVPLMRIRGRGSEGVSRRFSGSGDGKFQFTMF